MTNTVQPLLTAEIKSLRNELLRSKQKCDALISFLETVHGSALTSWMSERVQLEAISAPETIPEATVPKKLPKTAAKVSAAGNSTASAAEPVTSEVQDTAPKTASSQKKRGRSSSKEAHALSASMTDEQKLDVLEENDTSKAKKARKPSKDISAEDETAALSNISAADCPPKKEARGRPKKIAVKEKLADEKDTSKVEIQNVSSAVVVTERSKSEDSITGEKPSPGNQKSGWQFNLKYGAPLEVRAKDSLWYPSRALYYILNKDKNQYKLKIHYIGYPKSNDEAIELVGAGLERLREPTADSNAAAEGMGQIGNRIVPEDKWNPNDKKPYGLAAYVVKQGDLFVEK
ncbi:hypothetical protein HDU83_006127 [Entophlyctis luteolus]|nr:hypothetical protein HDU83_006127 [Entophlyctis luteolus]KAJ3385416.1 hypothetical protein HDU84_002265 [Entophlyctis sp. JEL0112]